MHQDDERDLNKPTSGLVLWMGAGQDRSRAIRIPKTTFEKSELRLRHPLAKTDDNGIMPPAMDCLTARKPHHLAKRKPSAAG